MCVWVCASVCCRVSTCVHGCMCSSVCNCLTMCCASTGASGGVHARPRVCSEVAHGHCCVPPRVHILRHTHICQHTVLTHSPYTHRMHKSSWLPPGVAFREPVTSLLCAAVKNVVRVFTWSPVGGSGGGAAVKFAREHVLDDDIVELVWAGLNLCIGTKACERVEKHCTH